MRTTSTRLLFQYWDHLRGARAAPERGEIEPGHLRHALLDIFMLENAHGQMLIRLGGTRLCALFGGEVRGRAFHDLWESVTVRVELTRMIDTVMDESAALIAGLSLIAAPSAEGPGERVECELLLLPLRHGGKTHARVMGALSPMALPAWLGHTHVIDAEIRSMRFIWPSGLPRATPPQRPGRARLTVLQGGRA